MKTRFKTTSGNLTFNANFFIAIGNNGNHIGYNRVWKISDFGYETKISAINTLRKYVSENGNMKFGLTPSRVVSASELVEMIESNEIVNFRNCRDIY